MADCVGGASCGTPYGYRKYACRGEDCVDANREAARERKRRTRRPDAAPRAAFVSAGAVRTHLLELRANGIGYRQIGHVSGVGENTVWAIAKSRQDTCSPETKDALLGVLGSMVAPDALVDSRLALEQLESLKDLGYTDGELAILIFGARPGKGTDRFRIARLRRSDLVTYRTADAIAALYADEFPDYADDVDPLADWLLAPQDESWRAAAECRRIDAEPKVRHAVFFPSRGEQPTFAREVCGRCPVQGECLDYALQANPPGIWGDTTGGDRRLIRRLGWDAADVAALRAERPGALLLDLLHDALVTSDRVTPTTTPLYTNLVTAV